MKLRVIFSIIFIFWAGYIFPNVGQPGIWKAGGGISLLLPDDSLASRYIKMESERVDLFVYTGFGIVHGQYTLVNTRDANVSFKIGYPVNALWRGEAADEPFGFSFYIDSLSGFEVKMDRSMEVFYPKIMEFATGTSAVEKWFIWDIQFSPGETRSIQVTYTTPASQAKVTNLKGQRKAHGLVYVFESGAIWKDKIGKAELFVHFMDGLSTEDVIGIRPCDEIQWQEEKQILHFKKEEWEPKPGENFYILFESRKHKYYSFAEGVEDRNLLYPKIIQRSKKVIQRENMGLFTCKDIIDIETKSSYTSIIVYILGGASIIFILLIYFIIKFTKIIVK